VELSTETPVYTSAVSMPGISGRYGFETPLATMSRFASHWPPLFVDGMKQSVPANAYNSGTIADTQAKRGGEIGDVLDQDIGFRKYRRVYLDNRRFGSRFYASR